MVSENEMRNGMLHVHPFCQERNLRWQDCMALLNEWKNNDYQKYVAVTARMRMRKRNNQNGEKYMQQKYTYYIHDGKAMIRRWKLAGHIRSPFFCVLKQRYVCSRYTKFRASLSVKSLWTAWPLKMEQIGFPETSAKTANIHCITA